MNLSGISDQSLWGKLLRSPLKLLPAGMQLPILQGKLRGKRWIVGSSSHGCWLGSYEYDKQVLFEKTIERGKIVFDLGGNVGFYTLLSSELVGPDGQVFVFEPVPRNIAYLKEHLRLNRVENVTVIEAAVSDRDGVISFDEGGCHAMGHLSSSGKLQVKTVVLDDLFSKGEIPLPDYIKMDIEGAELLALSGAKRMLIESHPVIFLATHGSVVQRECCCLLQSLGYQLQPIDGTDIEQSSEILAIY